MSRSRVTLLHAYSRRNSGDGLLVDISARLIREALGGQAEITLVASDPQSFADFGRVVPAPVIASAGWRRLWTCGATLAAIPTADVRALRRLLGGSDLIVGVGGGYLRARTDIEALKLHAGHMVQLGAAAESGVPAVYLPQSIGPALAAFGPLAAGLSGALAHHLGGLHRVHVRDGRSLEWLARLGNVRRAPDLAVLALGNQLASATPDATPTTVRHVAMVLREAPAWGAARRQEYRAQTRRLIDLLGRECRISFAVQSAVRGNDDARYYRSLGIEPAGTLRDLLRNDRPDAVVSVRLHGALESVLAGVPAFHLSYERKGFGAYEDLGLPEWVANANDFDPLAVLQTVLAPGAADAFHRSLRRRTAHHQAAWGELVDTLRHARDVSGGGHARRAGPC
ncbi:polysaccharide pyruvyl transferase family protein [Cupriavidus agavae]|uniref:Polysaccharide pyruvyl transferase WcaK-like protein n=1 Tax=Cupriavidus agavae TaxID=1001822 RepID=A0A4Q7S965_9BURK|nr:polysaccharide pyruvyl transferase family protein [Cupriavidus agavae]RZT42330.1 polysaccharide pyruvyl transferase WcaK-like protein [Cupriavidus agavae]